MKSVAFCISSESLFANAFNGEINPAVQKSIFDILIDHLNLQRLYLVPFDCHAPADENCIKALNVLAGHLHKILEKRKVQVICCDALSMSETMQGTDVLAYDVTLAFALMHSELEVDEFNFFVESRRAYRELRSVFQMRLESANLIADDVTARFHRIEAGVLTGRNFFKIGKRETKPDLYEVLLPMAKTCCQLAKSAELAPGQLEKFSREIVSSPSLQDLPLEEEDETRRMYTFLRRYSTFYCPKFSALEEKKPRQKRLVNSV